MPGRLGNRGATNMTAAQMLRRLVALNQEIQIAEKESKNENRS